MNIFNEKIVKKNKDTKYYIYVAGVIMLTIILIFVVIHLCASSTFLQTFWFLLTAGVLYLGWMLIRRKNIEYEYAFTSGDLVIDIIIDQKSRKNLFAQDCREFEMLAPYPEEFKSENNDFTEKLEAVSDMNAEDIYFIITNHEKKRKIIFFEPDTKMLLSFKQIIPRKIILRQADEESKCEE